MCCFGVHEGGLVCVLYMVSYFLNHWLGVLRISCALASAFDPLLQYC